MREKSLAGPGGGGGGVKERGARVEERKPSQYDRAGRKIEKGGSVSVERQFFELCCENARVPPNDRSARV